jgi:hypothetical protein
MQSKGGMGLLSARRIVAGITAVSLFAFLASASPAATEDALTSYGSSTVYVPFKHIYAFSVRCAALPCQIKLTEQATTKGQHIAGLDRLNDPPITMTEQPSAGPEPHCSEEEELESGARCPKKEAWEEAEEEAVYAVWFTPSDLNRALLSKTLSRDGSVTLHVGATLIDATGKTTAAHRLITLRPVAVLRRQEKRQAEEEKRKEGSPQGKIEHAEDEYCDKVLNGTPSQSFMAAGHVYTRCESRPDHEPEVTVSETDTRG